MQGEVWERMGDDPREVRKALDTKANPPAKQIFQQMLFSKIVLNCKKLWLLDAADGWLRERSPRPGSSSSRTGPTPVREYAELDAVSPRIAPPNPGGEVGRPVVFGPTGADDAVGGRVPTHRTRKRPRDYRVQREGYGVADRLRS